MALVGRVNAGKSSLLNALVGQERAIVDEAPGTTRDAVVAEVALDGVAVTLVDTAGERDGSRAARACVGSSSDARARRAPMLVVLVVDGGVGFGEVERARLGRDRAGRS